MKKLICFLFYLLAGIGLISAQTTRVTGTVIAADDNDPVIGASVVVKGAASVGTITNVDGEFTLNVPSNATTLIVSYIGMVTQEVAVRPNMRIILASDAQQLDEVVVTALGISRERKSLGYAVQDVKSDELTQGGQINLTGALTGKIAGVQVNRFGGTVGASSRITIRGNSSFAADQQPLFVVDGVPISNDTQRTGDNYYTGTDYGSGINDINPEDIESMTVLKGGSAALYGMRAGRGVILITTKKGATSKGVQVSYDGNITFSQAANLPKLQNSYGQGADGDEMAYQFYKEDGGTLSYQDYALQYGFNFNGINTGYDESWGPRLDVGLMIPQFDSPVVNGVYQPTPWISHPNNVRDFFQTGYTMNHTVTISSNTDQAKTRVSLSYRDEKGTIPNTDQTHYSGQFSTLMSLNKQFSVELMANYTRTHSNNVLGQGYGDNNPVNQLFAWAARQVNMKSLKDNWDQRDAAGNYTYYNWIDEYHMNPYFIVNKNTNSYTRDRIFGKSSVYYQPFDFLKIEGRLGMDFYQFETFERTLFHWDDPEGFFDMRNQKNTEVNLDFLATFNKTFGHFNVMAILGANYRDVDWASNRIGANQLTVPGVYTISNKQGDANTEMSHSHIRSNSVFGSASIGWKNQLYLDLSARNDWSSTILDPFFYPAASMSWIPTESFKFLQNDVLSFLKLRFGLSQVGAATSAYRNRAYYYAENAAFGGVTQTYRSMQYPNAHLRPEKMVSWEPGIEIGLFDNRLNIDVAYFKKITSDQIISVTTSNNIGFTSMLINAGKIETKGLEIQLRGNILKNPSGLNWTSTLNYSYAKSIVTELSPDHPELKTYQLGWTWGIPNQVVVGEEWGLLRTTGYNRITQEDIDQGLVGPGAKLNDIKVSSSGFVLNKADQTIAHVTPKFLASWRNDFTYKHLSVGFFLDLRVGGQIWSQTMSHSYGSGVSVITAENGIRERMIVPGVDVMKFDRYVMQNAEGKWVPNTIEITAFDWFYRGNSERYVFDGSFLKFREAYISYDIPSPTLAKIGFVKKAAVSFIGSNLWLMWVHKTNTMRLDPETGGVASDTRGVGYEQASVPNSRNYGIKLSLTF